MRDVLTSSGTEQSSGRASASEPDGDGAGASGAVDVLWLTDKRGKKVGVPAAKIAYIEVGTNDGDRRIGFGG